MSERELGIAEAAELTGLDQRLLRAWEARYGYPAPRRRGNGRRVYGQTDVDRLKEIARLRAGGLSVSAAIERTSTARRAPGETIFARLLAERPGLLRHRLPKGTMIALSHAIEDEYCARAESGVMIGSFQSRRHYGPSRGRWEDLAEAAELVMVFADFPAARDEPGRPLEVPLRSGDPAAREWAVICDAPVQTACLVAWERPGQEALPDSERVFEAIWSVEPELTRAATRAALELAAARAPLSRARLPARILEPQLPSAPEVSALNALANRMLAYVGGTDV